MAFRMYVKLNKHIYIYIKEGKKILCHVVCDRQHLYIQDLNIDSDMLDANENYFVGTYITDFNSFEMISASDVNVE